MTRTVTGRVIRYCTSAINRDLPGGVFVVESRRVASDPPLFWRAYRYGPLRREAESNFMAWVRSVERWP